MNDYCEPCIYTECQHNCGQLCVAKAAQSRQRPSQTAGNPLVAIALAIILLVLAASVAAQPVPKNQDKAVHNVTSSLVVEPVTSERTAESRQTLKDTVSETGSGRHATTAEYTGADRLVDSKNGLK